MTPHDPHIVRFTGTAHLVVESPIFGVVLRPLAIEGPTVSGVDPSQLERLFLVPEGHAVIDGEVVALELNEVVSLRGRLRWDAEIWRARGGAPDTEGRRGADEKEAPK